VEPVEHFNPLFLYT